MHDMSQVHFDSFQNIHQPFTQIKFNLNSTPHFDMNHVGKPCPIVIEKLMPPSTEIQSNSTPRGNMVSSLCSVISSDKLAMAVQLAKIDIKKLKTMLDPCQAELISDFTQKEETETNKAKLSKKKIKMQTHSTDEMKQRYSLSIYPEVKSSILKEQKPSGIKKDESAQNPFSKKENEIPRLRKELMSYAKTLGDVIKNLNTQPNEHSKSNESNEERKQKITRAEEQIHRSSRMLYMLQKNIQQLEEDLQKDVHHTKKSKSLENLALVHRAAIRALRTFVLQVPLYYDTNGNLPIIYKDLGLLIQQLSSLSTSVPFNKSRRESLEAIENLIDSLDAATAKRGSVLKPSLSSKAKFLKSKDDWLMKKAADLQIQTREKEHPERVVHQLSTKNKNSSEFKNSNDGLKKTSILLPHKLKKKKRNRFASLNAEALKMNFAASTVTSRIRKKPPVEKLHSEYHMGKKDRENKIVKVAVINSGSVKSKVQGTSLDKSNKTQTEIFQFKNNEEERSLIDESQNRKLQRLNHMSKKTSRELKELKKELTITDPLIFNAEVEIKEKLKPLLEKAQAIADEEAKRHEEYKTSVYRRLAEVASQKAMSEGERLAEYILDDLLLEAAVDLQRIDFENQSEINAAFFRDRPNLEIVEQRLQTFEKEEEEIRRHWQTITYSSLNNFNSVSSIEPMAFTAENKSSVFLKQVLKSPPPLNLVMSVPQGVFESVIFHKERYENFIQKKNVKDSLGVTLLQMSEELSEELLDLLLADVTRELNNNCDRFVEEVYEKEFVH